MRAVVGSVAAVVWIGLAGCGGGRSTHDVFVDDAARVCMVANARFSDLDILRPTAADAVAVLESVMTIGSDTLAELRELKPPTQDQVDVGTWLGTLEQALDEVAYTRDLVVKDRIAQALDAAVRVDLLTRRAQALARAVGLDRVCRVPRIVPQA